MTEPEEELWAVSVRGGTSLRGGGAFIHHVLATSKEEAFDRCLKECEGLTPEDVLEVCRGSRDDEDDTQTQDG